LNFLFRKKESFSDSEIISVLTSRKKHEDAVLRFLYAEVKPSITKFILNNKGDYDDVEDIIQDAIIVFYEKVKNNTLQLEKTVSGYIYTVGKYMWYNKLRKNKKHVRLENNDFSKIGLDEFDTELFHTNETSFVKELFNKIGQACQTVLHQSVFEKIAMDQIAQLNGYKNEQIARNKKYRCLKELRTVIEQSTQYQTIINELRYD